MKLHREGYRIILTTLVICIVLGWLFYTIIPWLYLTYLLFFGLALLMTWTISFFRVPFRNVDFDENAVIASADGKVVAIEEVTETEFFKDKRVMVSVFMSPFNVHVNWYPFSGKVVYTKYHKGKYLAAYNPKSSIDNERNTVVVENQFGKQVLLRQIAGVMARRIISYAKVGDTCKQGDEFGIIRYGSRVDFYFPLDASINVKLGDKVTGQKTVLGSW